MRFHIHLPAFPSIHAIQRKKIKYISLQIKGEELPGAKNIDFLIRNHQPSVVYSIGKVTCQKYTAMKDVSFGWQPDH